ncbi:chain-length determining protein [Mycobacterium sp. 852002-53434_SCH5985345]|uniref:polysaccharide biosynthesis tyrosine autokinase n=1 Tax=unclassified Mycobacterium TaxID=2642494 RepID=UPI0007FCE1E3|nr:MULTISPECIES: polysaccharide biosynthesis tyrosine autokinase [unclassified Mycobacterium]OBF49873.1 chain-length determining protein [Mycobacterium sp. 852002-53434_SCH5985345]OBF70961.1 chain-length determining protein [Mycobacterium sp. 852002-51613_SCH5001154]OBF94072.1 chain-length determining protein [Mycobacterium sp. 852014-52450_SCH5900713]
MDFRTFVRTLLTHWKLALGALLACTIGAAAVTALQTKHYQSTATILISFPGATDLTELYNGTLTAQERLSSYAQIAGGRTVAERAVNQLQAPISADALVTQTQVKYTAKSQLFTITVKDTDPNRAAALAGAMADQFAALVPTLGATTGPNGRPVPVTPGSRPDVGEPNPPAAPPSEAPGQPAAKPMPVARARVVEAPRVPDHPVTPVPVRNMAMGFVAGILLAIAVAVAREASDRTVRSREKLEQLSGLPTLAELPGRRGNTPRFGVDSALDDAVRGLRARLLRAMGSDARRVLVAAPFGGEGTTTTALNLSLALAEIGEDVLLVEGDTRRHVIAGLLRVESGEGLANALASPEIAAEAVKPTPIAKLFILASRSARRETPPCSAFLPEVIDRVMLDLSSRFDRIVVDGPPVLATPDSGLLAGAVSATVLVVRARRTTVDELNDALRALRSAGAQVVGTVLTDARPSLHIRAAAKTYRTKVGGPA